MPHLVVRHAFRDGLTAMHDPVLRGQQFAPLHDVTLPEIRTRIGVVHRRRLAQRSVRQPAVAGDGRLPQCGGRERWSRRYDLGWAVVADAPIGIFDSGYGGLTVARAVLDQLPHEPVLYLADTARQPYGPRRIADVRAYALECLDQLVERGVKILVIACNTASAAMLDRKS